MSGNVKIRGRVGGDAFEQSYPAKIVSSTSAGNAFVPRMFAAAKIADLERAGRVEDKERVVALSQRFAVASRFTSMIVLESEAMFKAFGLDKTNVAPDFTGEARASSNSSDLANDEAGEEEQAGAKDSKKKERSKADLDDLGGSPGGGLSGVGKGGGGQGFGSGDGRLSDPSPEAKAPRKYR